MKPELQRIAIAEACGITVEPCTCGGGLVKRDAKTKQHLPDYLNDLNAMHEAEKVLMDSQRGQYCAQLGDWAGGYQESCNCDMAIMASGAQRAEAFLKTIGKWRDEP